MTPAAWPEVALGDVCEIVSGATPKTAVDDFWGGDTFWATPKDLSDLGRKTISATPRTLTAEGLRSCGASVLPPGSVLLSSRAPIGLVAVNSVPMATNQGFKSLVPNEAVVDSSYLYWWLRSNQRLLQSLGRGATFKEISKSITAAVRIPLPPIDEQRRIAATLDQADALRAKRREALALLETLTESIFLDMFGDPVSNPMRWDRVPLGQILSRIDSGKSPVCLSRRAEPGEWGVLKLGAVTWCEYDDQENKALPADVDPIEAHEVRTGDLLFARKNTSDLVGACALVHSTRPRLLLSDLIFRLVPAPDARVVPAYLHRLMTLRAKQREIQKLASGSAGSMPNISKKRLLEASVELPPIDLQNTFAERIAAVDAQRRRLERSAERLDELFASLQQRAFRGEL